MIFDLIRKGSKSTTMAAPQESENPTNKNTIEFVSPFNDNTIESVVRDLGIGYFIVPS